MLMLKKLVLRHVLRKPAPEWISSDDGSTDVKAALLRFDGRSYPIFRVNSVHRTYAQGDYIESSEQRSPGCIASFHLKNANLVVRHWYRGTQIEYHGYLDYLWGTVSLVAIRAMLSEKLKQNYFNKTLKLRENRFEVLQFIVEEHIKRRGREGAPVIGNVLIHQVEVADLLYGERIYGHPSNPRILAKLDLILESLVQSGDIEEQDRCISVKGQALTTLTKQVEEDRRHRDNINHNRAIKWLTLILAFAAIAQVLVTIFA